MGSEAKLRVRRRQRLLEGAPHIKAVMVVVMPVMNVLVVKEAVVLVVDVLPGAMLVMKVVQMLVMAVMVVVAMGHGVSGGGRKWRWCRCWLW